MLAGALSLSGQRLWCKCGRFFITSWNPWSPHNSQHLIDFYTPSHLLHGLVFYAVFSRLKITLTKKFALSLLVEAFWEFIENTPFIINRYRSVTISLDYYGDSILNSLSDLSFCAIGFLVAAKVPAKVSVMIFIGFELATTFLIRDGLLLNVLMLLWPIDSVRVWQSFSH